MAKIMQQTGRRAGAGFPAAVSVVVSAVSSVVSSIVSSTISSAIFVVALITFAALAVTHPDSALAQQKEEKILNIYNWSDYIAEDTIRNFEKETGIKVRYDVFDSNEILHARLVAGKTGYDLVVPSSNWAYLQIKGGLLQKLDKSKLPNLVHVAPDITRQLGVLDPGNDYLVDWLWGITTVGINVKKVRAALGTMPMPANVFDLIYDPKYVSKLSSCGVSFLDSSSEVIPSALMYLGKSPASLQSADYTEVAQLLKKIRPYVTLFSSSGYINDMANGAICVALGWSGDINIAKQRALEAKNGNDIEALVGNGKLQAFFDTMAIPADAKHPVNAHLFMNYIMRPEVAASLTNKVFYANPNKDSAKWVKKEIADNKTIFLTPDAMKRLQVEQPVNNDVRRLVTRTYTQFKTGL